MMNGFKRVLFAAVAAMGFAAFGGNVPAIYMPVEYLASTSRVHDASQIRKMQWIDAGHHFKAGQTFRIEWAQDDVDSSHFSNEDKGWGCGGSSGLASNITGAGRRSNSLVQPFIFNSSRELKLNGTGAKLATSALAVGDWWVDTVSITNTTPVRGATLYYRSQRVGASDFYGIDPLGVPNGDSFDSGDNIYLFMDDSKSYPLPGKKRIRSAKLWDNVTGEMIFDLVPVRRITDGEPGFYDLVGETFIPYAGEGAAFALGPDEHAKWSTLTVTGYPAPLGAASPDWGEHSDAAVCTPPAAGAFVSCAPSGYTVATYSIDDPENPSVDTVAAQSYAYTPNADRRVTLTWNWPVPALSAAKVTCDKLNAFDVSAMVQSTGMTAGTAKVKIAWGLSADALDRTNDVIAVMTEGEAAASVEADLEPGATCFAKVFIESSDGWSALPVVAFDVPALRLENVLPLEYMPVEYLSSPENGSASKQWIDTGLHFKAGQTLTVKWAQESLSGLSGEDKGWGTGGGTDNGGNGYNITGGGRRNSNYLRPYIFNGNRELKLNGTGGQVNVSTSLVVGDWWLDTVTITADTLSYAMEHLWNGEVYRISPVSTPNKSFDSGNNIHLFKDDSANYPLPGKKRIQYATLRDDATGELLFDLVAVRHLSSGALGFYDRVSRTLLVNQGPGGAFGVGEDLADYWNSFTVEGMPNRYNTPTPDWGTRIGLVDGEKVVCTAPTAGGQVEVAPTGYELYTSTKASPGWTLAESGEGQTYTYVHQAGVRAKLVWVWNLPSVSGSEISASTAESFTVTADVTTLGLTADTADVYVAWGATENGLYCTNKIATVTGPGHISVPVEAGLVPNLTHYAKVFIVSADGYSEDNQGLISFDVPSAVEPLAPQTEYDVVEYIESHGKEYIDTKVNSSAKINVAMDIQFLKLPQADTCFFGERYKQGQHFAFWGNGSTSKAVINYGNYDPGSAGGTKTVLNERHVLSNQGPDVYVDGVLEFACNKPDYVGHDDAGHPLGLFAMRTGTSNWENRGFCGRLWGMKMWNDGQLVRDFIPVKRLSDQSYGLYDRQSGDFFGNVSGNGAFDGGPHARRANTCLTITAEPTEEGAASPAYGIYDGLAAGTSFACFAPVAAAGSHLTCLGATVYTNAADDATAWLAWQELQVADGRVTYTHPENSNAKLEWHLAAANPLGLGAVTLKSAGVNSLDVSVNVTGIGVEADSAELTLAYGVASDALDGHKSATVTDIESAVVTLQPLVPGTVYYVKATLSNAEGEVASDIVSLTVPAFHECEAGHRIDYYAITGKHGAWNTAHYAYAHTSVEADFTTPRYGYQCRPFSAGQITSGLVFEIYENGSGQWAYNCHWGTVSGPNTTVGDGGKGTKIGSSGKPVRWDITLDLYGTKNLTIVNQTRGETLYDESLGAAPLADAKSKLPIFLGALPLSETTFNNDPVADVQYHEVKIFEYGELAGDIIPYLRASDGAVGLYDRFTRKFLAWVAEDGATAATAPSPDAEPLGKAVVKCLLQRDGVKLTCGGDASDATLYRVSGNVYGAEDPAAWAAADDLGTLEASVSETTAALPDGWGEDATLMRFFVVTAGENETAVTNWSETVFWQDTDVPMFAGDLALDGVGGDTLVVEGELDNLGGDSCTLTVYTGPSADDLSVAWTGLEDSTRTATGPFALTLAGAALVPGETVYAVVEARAGKKVARSKVASVTLTADGVLTPGALKVEHKTIVVPFTIAQLGAKGQLNQVQLWVGPAAGRLELAETFDVPATAWEHPEIKVTDELSHLFDDFGNVYWQLRYVVTTAAGTKTLTDTKETKTQDIVDMAVYTWKRTVAEGDWTNPENWETDRPGDCLGYPQTVRATARFADDTTATVTLDAAVTFGPLDVQGTNIVLTVVGNGETMTGDMTFGGVASTKVHGNRIVFDNVKLVSRVSGDVDGGVRVELKNGTQMSFLGNNALRLMPGRATPYCDPFFRVGEGCTYTASSIDLGSDGVIELAGTVTVGNVYFNNGEKEKGGVVEGGWIRLVGENPQLIATGTDMCSVLDYNGAARGGFEFVIPKKGYRSVPVVGANANFAFNENSGGVVVRVLDESPAFTSNMDQVFELMSVKGVNTNKVAFQVLKREKRGSTFLYATDAADPVWTLPSETTEMPKAIGVKTIGAKGLVILLQ